MSTADREWLKELEQENRELKREGIGIGIGIGVARCTVERLMKKLGIRGLRRGKKCWTTISDDLLDRPTDKVNRQFVELPGPINCRWRILPLWRRGLALFMWLLSPMFLPGILLVGE